MLSTRCGREWFPTCGIVLLVCVVAGCSGRAAPTADSPPAAAGSPSLAADTSAGAETVEREVWDLLFMQGTRIGYNQTTIHHQSQDGHDVLRIEGAAVMRILRDSQPTSQETHFVSLETADGQLLSFEGVMKSGPVPVRTVGRVEGNRLRLTTFSAGKTIASEVPWSADYGGPYAMELSLRHRPLQAGEHRAVKSLMPNLNQVVDIELTARDFEPVAMPGGKVNLLRIDTAMRFPGGIVMTGKAWADRTGDLLKTYSDEGAIESVRATKAEALDEKSLGQFDLVEKLMIKLDPPLRWGHRSQQVRYRVELQGSDPSAVFVSRASQQVKPLGPNTAEIIVYAIRPGQPGGNPSAVADPPVEDDSRPNNMIQSDNAKIVAMAREAAGDEKDPWKTAVKLESYVHRTITVKDFSQAFATAAEVAETHEGDCTEHSVLLAALARARGIPARVAMGLVYVERDQSLAYHMWNELYIDGRWIPMDATLARGGIGGGHLELAHSSLQGASAYSSFLPVLKIAGRLRVTVEDEQGDKSP